MGKSFAWSWSALESFETCPRRHNLTRVTKEVNEGQSDAMLWGNQVHKALELRIKDRKPLSDTMAAYEPLAAMVEKAGVGGVVEAEQRMALDVNYNPTGYFAPDCWVRVIVDVTVTKNLTAFVGDWKTGNPKPASAQLKLCAATTFAAKPYLEKVVTSFIWLQHGITTNEVYTKSDVPGIWQEFAPRVQRMEHALTTGLFPPKPSGLCGKWCPVPKRLCEHSGKA